MLSTWRRIFPKFLWNCTSFTSQSIHFPPTFPADSVTNFIPYATVSKHINSGCLTSHLKGFSPECCRECTLRDILRLNDFPQVSHVNGMSFVCAATQQYVRDGHSNANRSLTNFFLQFQAGKWLLLNSLQVYTHMYTHMYFLLAARYYRLELFAKDKTQTTEFASLLFSSKQQLRVKNHRDTLWGRTNRSTDQ